MPGLLRYGTDFVDSVRLSLLGRFSRRLLLASVTGMCFLLLPAFGAEPKERGGEKRKSGKEIAGTLVIVGGGGMPEPIRERFLELAGGKKGRLVYIPTASDENDNISRAFAFWQQQGFESVKLLHTLDHKRANDPEFIKPLTEATAAWLGGGDQTRLSDAYRGTAVERELRRLLERGGVIGGTSAGASVMSSVMITGGNPTARIGQGFGLLPDVVIDQHFQNRKRQQRLLGVLRGHPDCLGMGIDESTAIVVRGHTFTVLGQANVSIFMPPREHERDEIQLLKAGDGGDLFQLSNRVLTRLRPPVEPKPVVVKEGRANTP